MIVQDIEVPEGIAAAIDTAGVHERDVLNPTPLAIVPECPAEVEYVNVCLLDSLPDPAAGILIVKALPRLSEVVLIDQLVVAVYGVYCSVPMLYTMIGCRKSTNSRCTNKGSKYRHLEVN